MYHPIYAKHLSEQTAVTNHWLHNWVSEQLLTKVGNRYSHSIYCSFEPRSSYFASMASCHPTAKQLVLSYHYSSIYSDIAQPVVIEPESCHCVKRCRPLCTCIEFIVVPSYGGGPVTVQQTITPVRFVVGMFRRQTGRNWNLPGLPCFPDVHEVGDALQQVGFMCR